MRNIIRVVWVSAPIIIEAIFFMVAILIAAGQAIVYLVLAVHAVFQQNWEPAVVYTAAGYGMAILMEFISIIHDTVVGIARKYPKESQP